MDGPTKMKTLILFLLTSLAAFGQASLAELNLYAKAPKTNAVLVAPALGAATATSIAVTNTLTLGGVAVETLDTAHPTTTALTYSGTNVTLTATSRQTYSRTLTMTNNCLLTITTTDGANGKIFIKPDASTPYTVYLDSGIRLQGVAASGSFVVTNSATETVAIAWEAGLRGASAVTLATKGYFP